MVFICITKISISYLTSFLRYCKDISKFVKSKKNQLHPSYFPWDTANLFGYFRYAWQRTPKMIVSTCRKLYVYLHLLKINFIIRFSLEILRKSYNMITEIIWELESKLCLPSLSQDLVGLTKKINISLCTCWQKLHSIP